VAEPVLLPRDPAGLVFNAWLRSVVRAHGFELDQTMASASVPWDRRLPPVVDGEAVAVMVTDWARESGGGLVAVPFDPPLSVPTDLVSRWPPTEDVTDLVKTALAPRFRGLVDRASATNRTARGLSPKRSGSRADRTCSPTVFV
jgi:hypothetical protein